MLVNLMLYSMKPKALSQVDPCVDYGSTDDDLFGSGETGWKMMLFVETSVM